MKKKSFIFLTILLMILGFSYAFFIYDKVSDEKTELVAGNIYMNYEDSNSITIGSGFPQTKEQGLLNDYFEFSVTGKNETTKDLYYAINLVYGDEKENKKRFHDEDIVFYLTEVIDGEEKVLIDSVQYKNIDNAKIWVENVSANTDNNIKHTYRLRAWISDSVVISDTLESADYTSGEYGNSYATIKINVVGNLKENDINMILTANDDNIINGRRAIDVDTYGYANDNLILEVISDNKNVKFMYSDGRGNSSEELNDSLTLNYNTLRKEVITTRVILVPENDANTKANIYFKLTRNGEVVEEQVKSVLVYGNNYCLNNGFNKLYDCILVSEKLSSSVDAAKSAIEAKGEPNLNDTAPSYTYVDNITYDVENVYSATGYQFYFGDSYEFNSRTGTFRLYNSNGSGIITDYLSDAYKSYYTCGSSQRGYLSCQRIFRIEATSVNGETYTISQGDKITSKVATSIKSEVGLYKTEDDYGNSYVFRGDVTSNNVLFNGYYWKIIRTNGEDSIRLIYNGTTSDATAISNALYTYSQDYGDGLGARYTDPTYVGYMYGKNFMLQTSSLTSYDGITPLTKYYFADGYEFDEEKQAFKLKKVNLEPVSGTFTEMKNSYATYPYTCKSTNSTDYCQVLLKVDSWVSEAMVKLQYISYSSVDKNSTRTNELSSNAKIQLESWYETNIVGKTDGVGNLITKYIVDATFCNDRSTKSSGYLLTPSSMYGAYNRLTTSNKTTNLICSIDIRDKFSSTLSRGNGLLEYPVALITADEVVLAGGVHNVRNSNYYLNSMTNYWTMTPSYAYSGNISSRLFSVRGDGSIDGKAWVNTMLSLRPVINLSNDVLISSGDGSLENPYTLKLA